MAEKLFCFSRKEAVYYLSLFASFLLFGINTILDLLLVIFIVTLLLKADLQKIVFSYLLIHFFENIIVIGPYKEIGILIFYPIILLKLLSFIIEKKFMMQNHYFYIICFFLLSCSISLALRTFSKAALILTMNFFIIILSTSLMRYEMHNDSFFERLIHFLLFCSICSIVYGILRGGFFSDGRGFSRFKGAYEPNYTTIYLNMGLIATIYLKDKLSKSFWFLLLLHLFFILLTQSTTGFIGLGLVILVYLSKYSYSFLTKSFYLDSDKTILYYCLLFLIFIVFITIWGLFTTGLLNKLIDVTQKILAGNLSSATSGRLPLMKTFLKDFKSKSFLNQMFGNGPTAVKLYSTYFAHLTYSHNSYIDILYSFGYIGSFIILIYLSSTMMCHRFMNRSIKKSNRTPLLLLRSILLISAIGLTMHAEIVFLFFFLF